MSSLPSNREPNDFTPVIGAMELAEYVFTITDNLSKFPDYSIKEIPDPEHPHSHRPTKVFIVRSDSLTNIVRAEAREIFQLTFGANEIDLRKQPHRKQERLDRQIKAIELCNALLADIQLCRKHFHLVNNRVLYWGKQVLNLRRSIEGWHESDLKRYKDIL